MSTLSRTSLATLRRSGVMRPAPRQVRFAHDEHRRPHLPFTYDPAKRSAFRAKYLAFVGTGFALPFVACYWQLRKGAGAA
ncbi:hypothetical protein QCA50_016080 [Cerrena zonata]|uniref:Cytochrome c oxidase subunit 8, mitochondrial n=1 Tax=Cerrena zonata TaxID=2478898 RepID=A0AAW0FTZ9_9APHY